MVPPSPEFPRGFLWGTATSAHQVEGNNFANDWWEWERRPGAIRDASVSGGAAEWWSGRAEEDLGRARKLGQNAHRMSIEWSRLEPEPRRWDDAAFARYSAILDAAKALGMRVLLTLNHFTLPNWLARRGGWLSPEAPAVFEELARRVALRLGPQVDLWCTQNEPNVLALMAYASNRWPPGAESLRAAFRALAAMLDGHARAFHRIRGAIPRARVGIVLNMPILEAARAKRRDRWVAGLQDWAFSGAILSALETGVVLPPLTALPFRIKGLRRSFDWLGVNYYGRYAVEFDPSFSSELFGRRVTDNNVRTEWNDWGEPCPSGLTRQLVRLSRLRTPLYVTENGIVDRSDARRPAFLSDHVRAVGRAIQRGSDVRGYFHWSLVDNFEWTEGWSAPFGLHGLCRETQRRELRASGSLYATICADNGARSLVTDP